MKAEILIRQVKAHDVQIAMQKIRKKYPFSRLISYKFDKNFVFERPKNFKNRTMHVAFVKDFRDIWNDED